MKFSLYILFLVSLLGFTERSFGQATGKNIRFDFYGDTIEFPYTAAAEVGFKDTLSASTINDFYDRMMQAEYKPFVDAILSYKKKHNPDDWVYYQLIRKTAQSMSPKADNYFRYTLYKWFLLNKSGYDATLNIVGDKLLFYVQSDEDIYDLPSFHLNGRQYICLNYHDYGFDVDFTKNKTMNVAITIPGAVSKFSYKLTQLPDFSADTYHDKDLEFSYHDVSYHFRIKISDDVKKILTNYPVADYQLYFNEPLSKETYNTLIPQLKKSIKGMRVKDGVDYLMHFTRYAFLYAPDEQNFGREKRLSPEQTLLYDKSDCEDRAALFYCLVKEIYDLPMVVLAFPHHLTVAVKFDKPVGKQVMYNGAAYSVCEPTPQADDLPIGALSPELNSVAYQVAYAYTPVAK
ncbi:MAG: hypothetical protein JWQ38_2638 [Flavipsychrobacter sp.]|nr:hypothetical protein [Flavipsychrobacter sp.]